MQSVAPSIEKVGSLLQWTADTTEHAHIKVIKDPAVTMNNHNYDSQICHYLDHVEKCHLFNTAVFLHGESVSVPEPSGKQDEVEPNNDDNDGALDSDEDEGNLLKELWLLK
ncbi:hypothetical protein ID866_10531 [Astraeus odoratus]|nr:hypothetical protein ID866_10531 [Astraeus odoratus]